MPLKKNQSDWLVADSVGWFGFWRTAGDFLAAQVFFLLSSLNPKWPWQQLHSHICNKPRHYQERMQLLCSFLLHFEKYTSCKSGPWKWEDCGMEMRQTSLLFHVDLVQCKCKKSNFCFIKTQLLSSISLNTFYAIFIALVPNKNRTFEKEYHFWLCLPKKKSFSRDGSSLKSNYQVPILLSLVLLLA